jgi:hypothetical protein
MSISLFCRDNPFRVLVHRHQAGRLFETALLLSGFRAGTRSGRYKQLPLLLAVRYSSFHGDAEFPFPE